MCRKPFIISVPSIALAGKNIWKSVTTLTSVKSYQAMERTNFYDAVYSPVILILNAVVVAAVMLLSASGNKMVLTFFWNVCGNCSGCDQLYFTDFSPVESLGMEIQTIQSAVAGIHRINEFFGLEEKEKWRTGEWRYRENLE